MKSNLKSAALGVALAALPALLQAQDPYPPLEACGVHPLVAGGGNFGTLVGRVLAETNGDLKITFDTTAAADYDFGPYIGHFSIPGDWFITEVHVDAKCLVDENDSFPANKQGNPKVGKFAVSEKLGGVQSFTASLPGFGEGVCPEDRVYVAAHAVVTKAGMPEDYMETAWGAEIPLNALTGAAQWAQFFEVDLYNCDDQSGVPPQSPNHVPVARDDAYEFEPTQTEPELKVPPPGLLANDSDQDGDTITVASVNGIPVSDLGGGITGVQLTLPQGAILVEDTGDFAFAPTNGYTDSFTFTYTATDGLLTSAPATVTITVDPPAPPPTAQCYQCSGLDCLLTPVKGTCPDEGKDLCYTLVDDTNGVVRTISRGCGSSSDEPAPSVPSETCKNVEVALLGAGTTCKFYCDGVTDPNCNEPPSLIPTNGREPDWQ